MVIKKINRSVEIDKKYESKTEVLNKPEHKKATKEMNEAMRIVRRDFIYMSKKSEQSAANVFFTS